MICCSSLWESFEMFLKSCRISIALLVLSTLLLGGIYPAVVTLALQKIFPHEAEGSLIRDGQGKILGSTLIGQDFSDPKYFWGRLSATTPAYNAAASSGSNLSVNNPDLLKAVADRVKALSDADPENTQAIPADLVTSSASGLDPHISPAAAEYQVHRVAIARGLPEDQIRQLVAKHTQGRQFGILGEPVVNVLELNLEFMNKP